MYAYQSRENEGLREFGFEGLDGVDGPGVDVVLQRDVATHPVTDVHEVEQLREVMESGQWREPRFSQQHAVT